MARDITMLLAVLVSTVSLLFGAYKHIEARNSTAFIYEQAYRIIGQIQGADINNRAKEQLVGRAMSVLGTPPGVLDVGRSSADVGSDAPCSPAKESACTAVAATFAAQNGACARGSESACTALPDLRSEVASCTACFR